MRRAFVLAALVFGLAAATPVAAQDRGGAGNPPPSQSIGPPNAGAVVLEGAPGSNTPAAETAPAKHSEANAALDAAHWLDRGRALSEAQRQMIYESLAGEGAAETVSGLYAEPSTVVPHDLKTHELPAELTREIPYIGGFRFVTLDETVLLIDPVNRVVAAVIGRRV